MTTLQLELTLLRIKHNKTKRIQRSIHGSFSRVFLLLMKYVVLAHKGKAKIEHCSLHFVHHHHETVRSVLWGKLKRLLSQQMSLHPAGFRISVLIILNIAVASWMVHMNIFNSFLSYNYAKGEAIVEKQLQNKNEKVDLEALTEFGVGKREGYDQNRNDENKKLIEELNAVFSQDEKCRDSKNKGECVELCQKNEEEIIAKMKEEERRAWLRYFSSHPKITVKKRISCHEKNDGNPSHSKTKGKHMDEDCCPDPDEWPKPGCVYSESGLELMLKGPKK